jgi:hypothetical protein
MLMLGTLLVRDEPQAHFLAAQLGVPPISAARRDWRPQISMAEGMQRLAASFEKLTDAIRRNPHKNNTNIERLFYV